MTKPPIAAAKKSKPSPKSRSRKPGPAPVASSGDDEEPVGSQADFERFLPAARAIPAHEVRPMRADLVLALQNAQTGRQHVLAEKARLAKLPETKLEDIETIDRVVLATIYADTQIPRTMPASEQRKNLAILRPLRLLLLVTADSLAEAGLLSRAEVAAIRKGRGDIDAAKDCVALAALFRKNAAKLRGKHAVSAAQLKQADELGAALLKTLKPARARRAKTAATVEAVDRDRLWTLVERRHEQLWRAGAYLFGRAAVDAKVPSLQAVRGGRGNKADKAAKPKAPATP